MDRLWWPNFLACTFTRPDSTRLLSVDSEEDLLAQVMAAMDVGLQGIGDCVYENMVRRYHARVEIADHHIEPFL